MEVNNITKNGLKTNYSDKFPIREVTEDGLSIIKTFESFSPKTYICPAGFKTIGYGHLIKKNEKFGIITEEEAVILLKSDILVATRAVARYINSNITDSQFSALVSFTFNLGAGALQSSSLRQKINYDPTCSNIYGEFLKWVYAGGRKLAGLERRRRAEADLYFSDIYSG